MVCEALFTTRPTKKVQRIGLYDIVSKLDQDDRFTVFLARHRFIQTQPLTVLKVYHLDVYATADEKQYRIREIFHSHDAMRLAGDAPEPRPLRRHVRLERRQLRRAGRLRRGRATSRVVARQAQRAGFDLGRENPDHQGRGRGAGARPQARRHPPGRPPPQHRHRPGRGRQAGELRSGVHPGRPESQHRPVGP